MSLHSFIKKNAEHIVDALSILAQRGIAFRMLIYGPKRPDLEERVKKYGLGGMIEFKDEVPQPELAKAIQQSDGLILYSRFETFGCVLIEANACGVPVIISDIKVFHEIVDDGVNGVFVPGENPQALAETLTAVTNNNIPFDREKIALDTVRKYNYENVGKQFSGLYEQFVTQIKKN